MAYKKQSNDKKIEAMHKAKLKRWDNSSLGAQVGGLIHDAVALAIATKKVDPADIKHYLDMLYIIAENKKEEVSAPSEVDWDKAQKATEEFNRRVKESEKRLKQDQLEDINAQLQAEAADLETERQAERSYMNK